MISVTYSASTLLSYAERRSRLTEMIISNNVLQRIEPFHVYRHLPEENVWLCLSFEPLSSFFLGSPGPQTVAVCEGPLGRNHHQVFSMFNPGRYYMNSTQYMGECAYKTRAYRVF